MNNINSDSYITEIRNSIINKLISARRTDQLSKASIILMNDFLLDRIVQIRDLDHFKKNVKEIYQHKGGSYPHSIQVNQRGGNAVNCASTLGHLGVKTYFIGRTDELGKVLLEYYLHKQSNVDITHVQTNGRLGATTAIEIGEDRTNIMINDLDSCSPFGFNDLNDDDRTIMAKASLIGVFDWTLNTKGTDLASGVFDFAQNKNIPTYYDTADPASRKDEIPELFSKALQHPGLSYLSVNENEIHQYTNQQMDSETRWPKIKEIAAQLKRQLHAELQVHTATFSAVISDNTSHVMPTYKVTPLRTTGAGDNWNAGNILGILLNLEPEERLLLANSTACFYITKKDSSQLSFDNLIDYLSNSPGQMNEVDIS